MQSSHTRLRRIRLAWILALIGALGVAAPRADAQAAGPSPRQAADLETMRDFPLSMDVLQRMAHAVEAANREHLPCLQSHDPAAMRSIDAMAHALSTQNPRAVPLLARYGFTPRQFVTATGSLMTTMFAARALADPGSPFAQTLVKKQGYNTANVAFFDAHRAEIMPMLQRMRAGSSCGE